MTYNEFDELLFKVSEKKLNQIFDKKGESNSINEFVFSRIYEIYNSYLVSENMV